MGETINSDDGYSLHVDELATFTADRRLVAYARNEWAHVVGRVEMSPTEARRLAAALTQMADRIEGEKETEQQAEWRRNRDMGNAIAAQFRK